MANGALELGSLQIDLNNERNKDSAREAEEESRALLFDDANLFAKRHEKPQKDIAPPVQPVERWPMPRGIIQQDLQLNLTREEKDRIGKRIWRNESGGTVDGLTAWNKGEEFPSLGIGHFIWMPKGVKTPFGDSFPEAMEFLRANGKTPPAWIQKDTPAPWNSRDEFYRKFNTKQMTELRTFLSETVPEQTDFIIDRLEKALPKILAATPDADKQKVQERFYKVLNSGPAGVFALADYVNFKGEGGADPVQYNNQGWGMRHVLQNMKDLANPVKDFSVSAREMLERRVKNAPPERHEERWLKGWTKRVEDYVNDPPIRAIKRNR